MPATSWPSTVTSKSNRGVSRTVKSAITLGKPQIRRPASKVKPWLTGRWWMNAAAEPSARGPRAVDPGGLTMTAVPNS
ncbi:hypothetical protein C1Y40_00455 [Mycobacterium talmoniae]|uniref:Uncharacterized protein n=1 Tax=Mycobacterium talmoniae TaxID=1858794 RepID=A0A2S8BRP4_9MYCO|nr:hypothetical protein C1Y40_00455 [Mycobacterium talmoniae]